MAQLYINLEQRPVSDRENLAGTLAFFAAAVSVVVITYLNYSAIAYQTYNARTPAQTCLARTLSAR